MEIRNSSRQSRDLTNDLARLLTIRRSGNVYQEKVDKLVSVIELSDAGGGMNAEFRKLAGDLPTESFETGDGVRIHYVDAGRGHPVVMLTGFSQSAAEFGKQIDDLSSDYRVIAMDYRGHGASEKPDHGYRVSRLATDLRELLVHLDLQDATLLGHSLGCTVIWSYWDTYGRDRIDRLVLVDQAAVTTADLVPPDRVTELGGIFTFESVLGLTAAMREGAPEATARLLVDMMHTPEMSDDDVEWLVEQNQLLPRQHAATLTLDHCGNDWRDVLPRITVPTLVIGGAVSIFDARVPQWVAAQIPGAQCRVFSAEERGSHLMFWENDKLFNAVVREFLESTSSGPARS